MWNDYKDELKTVCREHCVQAHSCHRCKNNNANNEPSTHRTDMKVVILNKNQRTLLDSLLIELFLMIPQLITNINDAIDADKECEIVVSNWIEHQPKWK